MLYIGPWLEYKLAKQLEERESLRPEASHLPRIGRSAARNSFADPSSARKTNALPQFAACDSATIDACVQQSNPVVSAPCAYQRRDFFGEARSMRRFQNELASLRSPSKPIRRPPAGPSPARVVPASTNKRLVQIQRMQTIYRQGKEKAQTQARDKPRNNIILPSIHRTETASSRQKFSRQIRTTENAAIVDDSDDDDELLAWAGGLDLGSI